MGFGDCPSQLFAEATLRRGIHDQKSGGSQYHLGTSDFSVSDQNYPPVNIQQDVEKPTIFAEHFPKETMGFPHLCEFTRVYKLLGVPKFEPIHTQPDWWKQKAGCPRPLRLRPDLSIGPRCQATGKPTSSPVPGAFAAALENFGNLKESERNELKWGVGNNL